MASRLPLSPPPHTLNGTAIKKITLFYFCSFPYLWLLVKAMQGMTAKGSISDIMQFSRSFIPDKS